MSRSIQFSSKAWVQYTSWRDSRMIRRINRLIQEINRDSTSGIGKPELLRGTMSGWASRRIDDEHRLVYRVRDEVIEILACRDHYTTK